jgi:hypothetical protein
MASLVTKIGFRWIFRVTLRAYPQKLLSAFTAKLGSFFIIKQAGQDEHFIFALSR